MTSKFKVGDRVHFSEAFLQSTGQQTGDTAFDKGDVTEVKFIGKNAFARVKWSDGHESLARQSNLSKTR